MTTDSTARRQVIAAISEVLSDHEELDALPPGQSGHDCPG